MREVNLGHFETLGRFTIRPMVDDDTWYRRGGDPDLRLEILDRATGTRLVAQFRRSELSAGLASKQAGEYVVRIRNLGEDSAEVRILPPGEHVEHVGAIPTQ